MHQSAMEFAGRVLTRGDIEGRVVVEAGAVDVNGSVRNTVMSLGPASYLGTDMREGQGVDMICAAEELPARLGAGHAGVVICTEMLEHAEDWRAAMRGLTELLEPGGVLLLTTRGPGFGRHDHPGDYWRFTPELMGEILAALGLEPIVLEADVPVSPGVLSLSRKTGPMGDLSGIEALSVD